MMDEAALQDAIVDLARRLGWRVAHFRPARTENEWSTPVQYDAAGWPDLFMVRGDRTLAVEVKSAKGRLTASQDEWLVAFNTAGITAVVVRPNHWPDAVKRLLDTP